MIPSITALRMSGARNRAELPLLVLGPSLGTSATTLWTHCAPVLPMRSTWPPGTCRATATTTPLRTSRSPWVSSPRASCGWSTTCWSNAAMSVARSSTPASRSAARWVCS